MPRVLSPPERVVAAACGLGAAVILRVIGDTAYAVCHAVADAVDPVSRRLAGLPSVEEWDAFERSVQEACGA